MLTLWLRAVRLSTLALRRMATGSRLVRSFFRDKKLQQSGIVCLTMAVLVAQFPAAGLAQPTPPECSAQIQPTGSIADRWALTGGATGPMGCPVTAAQVAAGGSGQVVQFQNGQIVTSPSQGTNMTVAVYQQLADLVLEWGDTAPYSYDESS